jgi:4-hydroxyacetophenone monooxygenase
MSVDELMPDLTDDLTARQLRGAIESANLPTLLMVLVQLTGDLSWLDEPFRPTRGRGVDDNDSGGFAPEVQQTIRAAAFEAVLAWRAGTPPAIAEPSPELAVRMLTVAMGEQVSAEFGPRIVATMAETLGATRPSRSMADIAARRDFRVIIIGAGPSGLNAAIKLKEFGIPFTLLEKSDQVGGSWHENRYPGAGVDTPSLIYSFSFVEYDWPHYFASRQEVQGYLDHVATRYGLYSHIRFGVEVTNATFDEAGSKWRIDVQSADGPAEGLDADVLISAVGAFNPPRMPVIAGLPDFAGPSFHTARWPAGLVLSGKRVGVIGNGASAMQVVPAIASQVKRLSVFQRSAQWIGPFPKLGMPISERATYLMRNVPYYRAWYRQRLGWMFGDRIHPSLRKDPSWPHPERAISAVNDGHRRYFTRYLESQLADRPDLIAKCLPAFPALTKRLLLDNGWFGALKRDNVDLITDNVLRVSESSVETTGGRVDLDILILATGFDVTRFISTFEVIGAHGRRLREVWDDDDAQAYLGLAIPGYPNFFMLYGPNTAPGGGGSLLYNTEAQVHYIVDLIVQMLAKDIATVACRQNVYEEYNARIVATHDQMIYSYMPPNTYYRNSKGRVTVNCPFRNVDFWTWTRHAELADYHVRRVGG